MKHDVLDLCAWANENYDVHWRYTTFADKMILDLGCEFGSSAAYFLRNGAKKVVGADIDLGYINVGRWIWDGDDRVTLVHRPIIHPTDIEELIGECHPDLVKMDIEGGERHFLDCNTDVITSVPEYLIETHNAIAPDIYNKITNLLTRLGYDVEFCCNLALKDTPGSVDVIYAKKVHVDGESKG